MPGTIRFVPWRRPEAHPAPGRHFEYLVKEFRGLKTGACPDIDGTMASAAQPLSEKDITDMAAYLAGLK